MTDVPATPADRPNTIESGGVFEQSFCIDAGHPALPGHFPGHPLVPGVILLEQVAQALRAWRGQRLARVLEAKFVASLLPSEQAVVRLSTSSHGVSPQEQTRVRFEIFRDDLPLARGVIEGVA
jgi:3-hydroxymyristoyl/3-hydroxydecanoyl-(acyl carrier protein) dehydratase